jgi:peptidyl-prolyl cis-trans isomerase SurA
VSPAPTAQGPSPAAPPAPPPIKGEVLDRTVALVGDEVILLSEVDEEVLLGQAREGFDISNPDTLRAYRMQVLGALIESRLLLVKAHEDGIRSTPEEVEDAVQKMIGDLKARFPTEDAFNAQLTRENMTLDKLHASYTTRLRDQIEIGKLIDKNVRSKVHVEEPEIRAYWDAHNGELPPVPATLEIRRIRIAAQSLSPADSATTARANIVMKRLQQGEDFATLASVFSEGPDASRGGDLGWFRKGDLDPILEGAVDSLQAGEISKVVVTARGTHILKLEEREQDRFHLRQIVFLRNEEVSKSAAKARAESLRRRIEQGEDFVTVAQAESEEGTDASQRGRVIKVAIESLEPSFRSVLEQLEPGQMSQVLDGKEEFWIVRVESRAGERKPTYEEAKDRLEDLLRQEKTAKAYDEFVEKIRAETVVEILPEPGS